MLVFVNPRRERPQFDAARADTEVDLPDSAVLEDLQLLQACLLSSEQTAPSAAEVEAGAA